MRALPILMVGGCLAGCQPADTPIPITARAGDLAAIAAGDNATLVRLAGDGLPSSWTVVDRVGPDDMLGATAGEGPFPPIAIPSAEERLAIWLVPSQLLVSTGSAPFAPDDLNELALRAAGRGAGGQCTCNACGEIARGQLLLEPGGECPIPDFAGGAQYVRRDERWSPTTDAPGCALRLAHAGTCSR